MSETSHVVELLRPYIEKCMAGIDLGYGGHSIHPRAITLDLEDNMRYGKVGNDPQNLIGTADDLYWFHDNALDYVYSSHLLEDFTDTVKVLKEWIRVLKIGGLLILLLPDEIVYRDYCKQYGTEPNQGHHVIMSLNYLQDSISKTGKSINEVKTVFPIGCYSFLYIGEKVR